MKVATTAEETIDQIVSSVRAVPGVADLSGGPFGTAATYLPNRRVLGVELHEGRTAIHVTATYGEDLHRLCTAVRTAVAKLRPGTIDVTIEDLELGPRSSKEN